MMVMCVVRYGPFDGRCCCSLFGLTYTVKIDSCLKFVVSRCQCAKTEESM